MEDLNLDKNEHADGFDLAMKGDSKRFIKIQTMKMCSDAEENE